MPAPVARVAAGASRASGGTLRLKGSPPVTRLAYWLSAQECTIDISRARAELGYEPVRTIARRAWRSCGSASVARRRVPSPSAP